jgi:hypothetical protein
MMAVSCSKNKKAAGGFFFELIGEDDGRGGTRPIKGCKTNSKGMVVAGTDTGSLTRPATSLLLIYDSVEYFLALDFDERTRSRLV